MSICALVESSPDATCKLNRGFGMVVVRVFVMLWALSTEASVAIANDRIALTIGINTYDALKQLKLAVNDANLITSQLAEIGYDVIAKKDVSRAEFLNAWKQTLDKLTPAMTLVVFFAGHAVEIDGQNYLLLRDTPKIGANDVEKLVGAAISLETLLLDLRQRRMGRAIIILDACRDNPFIDAEGVILAGGNGGLAPPITQPDNTIIVYSASSGETALDWVVNADEEKNSLFTRHFANLLSRSDLTINGIVELVRPRVWREAHEALKAQTPVMFNRLSAEFCLPGDCAPLVNRALQADAALQCESVEQGVHWHSLPWRIVLDACQRAATLHPTNLDYRYAIARAWDKAKVYQVSTPMYAALAHEGYVRAMIALAWAYNLGQGIPSNMYEARRWYERAAFTGSPYGMSQLGHVYRNGIGGDPDPQKARQLFQTGVRANLAGAMLDLAKELYDQSCEQTESTSSGGATSREEAFGLWRQAANQHKHPVAFGNIGWAYREGVVVDRNISEARRYFLIGAELGDSNAMANLGWLYLTGNGPIKKDTIRAKSWFERAHADPDQAAGTLGLAHIYRYGLGVDQDYIEAIGLYREAMRRGARDAYGHIGSMLIAGEGFQVNSNNIKKGIELLKRGTQLESAVAMTALGWAYENGIGVDKEQKIAIDHYEKAAAKCNSQGLSNLGIALLNGAGGIEKNIGRGLKYLEKAVSLRNWEAGYFLGRYYFMNSIPARSGDSDDSKSIAYWRESASHGYDRSKLALCTYLDADRARRSAAFQSEAVAWCEAATGSPIRGVKSSAHCELGRRYYVGDGVTRNAQDASRHLIAANELGCFDYADILAHILSGNNAPAAAVREAVESYLAYVKATRKIPPPEGYSSDFRRQLRRRLQAEGTLANSVSGNVDDALRSAIVDFARRSP